MNPDSRTRALGIADDWDRVTRTPLWHSAGCRCGGGAGCLPVDLASTEADLLESAIQQAHVRQDRPAESLALARLAAIRAAGDQAGFADWIRQLPDSGLPEESLDQLLSTVERFVDSLGPPPASRFTAPYLGDLS